MRFAVFVSPRRRWHADRPRAFLCRYHGPVDSRCPSIWTLFGRAYPFLTQRRQPVSYHSRSPTARATSSPRITTTPAMICELTRKFIKCSLAWCSLSNTVIDLERTPLPGTCFPTSSKRLSRSASCETFSPTSSQRLRRSTRFENSPSISSKRLLISEDAR